MTDKPLSMKALGQSIATELHASRIDRLTMPLQLLGQWNPEE
jgi:hypothetical protein